MRKDSRVLVTGGSGLVGSALRRLLAARGFSRVAAPSRAELDLSDRGAVERYFARARPEYVLHAAAKVGGIAANAAAPADFLRENLALSLNVVEASRRAGVARLLNFGSTCVYPKLARVPTREDSVLTGPIEPTNEAFAVAKIAGLKLCEAYARQHGCDFFTVVPCNLYGPGDRLDEKGHVVSGLMLRVAEALECGRREATVWGSGAPRRELLYVDDLADACLFLLSRPGRLPWSVVNVGSGRDVSIRALAASIKAAARWDGRFVFDRSKPDGAPRRLLDGRRLRSLGWRPRTPLDDGLRRAWRWLAARRKEEQTA